MLVISFPPPPPSSRKVNQKLSKVKGLADSDSDDEVLNWVAKSRKSEAEKKKAAERAKMLDEMDDEFGVGKIVEEETQRRGGQLLGELSETIIDIVESRIKLTVFKPSIS